jgi:DNA-binding winged helix-turn-helix (wHTH) protein
MSKTLDFTCPKCGFIIKAPYTEQAVADHMKTHSSDKTARAKISKSQLIKLQKR